MNLPFLKWAGGKRWFIRKYSHFLPKRINGKYIEPFLGSGAVFFHLRPLRSVISDTNCDLINAYTGIKLHQDAVRMYLQIHHINHSEKYYYQIRSTTFTEPAERAAQFIYLNRTCFNGIYRVNAAGKFNVPIGNKTAVLLPTDDFERWSKSLKNTEIQTNDFEKTIDMADKGDFLFIDPPYTVRHNVNGFIKYNEVLFSWEDQERLAQSIDRARLRGARILMTNANHVSIHSLYSRKFKKQVVSRYSSISADSKGRSSFEELIISI